MTTSWTTSLKGTLDVIAGDETFLLVVQEYIRRTQVLH